MESHNPVNHTPTATDKTISWRSAMNNRLDKAIAQNFTLYSRSFLTKLITRGYVTINGTTITKSSHVVKADDTITITFPTIPEQSIAHELQAAVAAMNVKIIYEHQHFLVLSKPAGLMVHKPNPQSTEPTLVDWLVHHFNEIHAIGSIERPGIVHRLDKDTSGLIIIARTNYAHKLFNTMFKDRSIHKTYLALVHGHPPASGSIDLAIGRHPVVRSKMATFPVKDPNKAAIRDSLTKYQVIEYYPQHSLVEFKPVTGRTHQIRVHAAGIHYPLLGDKVYGKESVYIKRHALHAHAIEFIFDGVPYSFTQPLPDDFVQAQETLKVLNS